MSERRTVKFYQADVFTDTVFGGNPVAVVPDAGDLDGWEMQKIAREMNLSETVFVLPPTDPSAEYRLRFFTPVREIPFAGHSVIGAFYVLAHAGGLRLQEPVTLTHQQTRLGGFALDMTVRDRHARP